MEVDEAITLSVEEEELFEVILAACARSLVGGTVARVCGGWVRDKMLGEESHDVDVTINNLTGTQFAQLVQEVLASRGAELSKLCVIAANPDQSKHLETATMRVFGEDVDFASLRCETYASDSRIPTVAAGFGSALDDARRRDLTINAMFYNINERAVEDPTGRGLRDLRCGLASTPLEPLTTFTDDPLRVLRAVRFATRFDFAIDAQLCAAASSDVTHTALRRKGVVSPEEEGAAWEASIATLRFAHRNCDALAQCGVQWESSATAAAAAAASRFELNLERCKDEVIIFLLALMLYPLAGRTTGAGAKQRGLVEAVVMDSLKSSRRIGHSVQLVIDALPLLRSAVASGVGSSDGDDAKGDAAGFAPTDAAAHLQIGLAVRTLGELWPTAWRLATLTLIADACPPGASSVASSSSDGVGGDMQLQEDGAARLVSKWPRVSWSPAALSAAQSSVRFCRWLHTSALSECWKWRPLLNGGELIKLGVPKGLWIGVATAKVMEWQIMHPRGEAAESRAWAAAVLVPELVLAKAQAPPPPTKKQLKAEQKKKRKELQLQRKREKDAAVAAEAAGVGDNAVP